MGRFAAVRLFPSQRSHGRGALLRYRDETTHSPFSTVHGRVALLRDRDETTHPPFLAVAQERDPPSSLTML